jgi:hypothetical protein
MKLEHHTPKQLSESFKKIIRADPELVKSISDEIVKKEIEIIRNLASSELDEVEA